MRRQGCSCGRANGDSFKRPSPCNGGDQPCRTTQCNAQKVNGVACEGEQLLALIRRLDFALVETNLYLDTHPYSQSALRFFERLLCERNQAAERYEAAFGPLTATGNGARDEWTWSTGAWPWQIDKESKR